MIDFKNNYTFLQEGANRQEAANIGITDRVPIIAQMPEFARKELNGNLVENDEKGNFALENWKKCADKKLCDRSLLFHWR